MRNDFNRQGTEFDRSFKRMTKLVYGMFVAVGIIMAVCIIGGIAIAAWGVSNLGELGEYLIRLKSA